MLGVYLKAFEKQVDVRILPPYVQVKMCELKQWFNIPRGEGKLNYLKVD